MQQISSRLGLFITLQFALTACASVVSQPTQTQATQVKSEAPYETDRLDANVVPKSYQVELSLDPEKKDYSGNVSIELELKTAQKIIWLHSLRHEIEHATFQDASGDIHTLTVSRKGDDWLGLEFSETLVAQTGTLSVQFKGAMDNPLFGMYRVKSEKRWYIFSQMEPLGAREAFPCFDEPRFKVPFTVSFNVPEKHRAFFNTPIKSVKTQNGMTTHQFATSKPLPTYLLAMAIGPLEVIHNPADDIARADGTTLQVRIITAHGKSSQAAMALRETKKIMAITEDYFGMPYPYEKLDLVAVPDFEAGAMENPGLITYRDSLLLFDEATVTDRQLASYANTHAHELAHIWFGDLVTMPWWDDLWLNEAFATWFAGKVVSKYRPDWKNKIGALGWFTWVMEQDSNPKSRRIREPIKTRGDIDNAFDGITYGKGYAVLAMFENLVGEEAFQTGIRQYLKDHAWGNATSGDLIAAFQKASGHEGFSAAFKTFLEQPGVPLVSIDPGTCTDGKMPVQLSQTRWQPLGGEPLTQQQWHTPICLQAGPQGEKVCTILKEPSATLQLPTCPNAVVPNPGGVAYLLWSMPTPWLDKLLTNLKDSPEIDRVSAVGNIRLLYQSGALSAADLLSIAPAMLSDKSVRVRNSALSLIGTLSPLVTSDFRPQWNKWLGNLVAPLVQELGWGSDTQKDPKEIWDLRKKVLSMAGKQGADAAVIAEATKRSQIFLKGGEIKRELAATALTIYAYHNGSKLFKEIQVVFENETDIFRRRVLRSGLTSFAQPDLVEPMISYAFSDALRDNERDSFIFAPNRSYRTRELAWTTVKSRLDEIRTMLPAQSAKYLPYLLSSHCSEDALTELTTIFEPWVNGPEEGRVKGVDRHLSATENRLKRCLALRTKNQLALSKMVQQ